VTAIIGPHLAAELARPPVAGARAHGTLVFAAIEFVCFGIAALLARRNSTNTIQPLLVIVLAEALRSHPEGVLPLAGALLAICHMLPALVWAGMLVYTLRAAIAWRNDPPAMRGLIQLYSGAAAWLFAVILVTGLILALLTVRHVDALTTTYGVILIVKAALVAAAAVLALIGRRWLHRPATADPGPARASKLEAGALIAVLVITAILTVVTPPAKTAYQAGGSTRLVQQFGWPQDRAHHASPAKTARREQSRGLAGQATEDGAAAGMAS
jgi:copper transport protein